jgi:hypothetical protein
LVLDRACARTPSEAGEGEDAGTRLFKVLGERREFLGQRVDDPVDLGVHRFGVGLVVD